MHWIILPMQAYFQRLPYFCFLSFACWGIFWCKLVIEVLILSFFNQWFWSVLACLRQKNQCCWVDDTNTECMRSKFHTSERCCMNQPESKCLSKRPWSHPFFLSCLACFLRHYFLLRDGKYLYRKWQRSWLRFETRMLQLCVHSVDQ